MASIVNTLSQVISIICLVIFIQTPVFANEILNRANEKSGSISLPVIKKPGIGDDGRRIQTIQIPDMKLNFRFRDFTTKWFFSENDWKNFWEKFSRSQEAAPAVSVDWDSEQILAIFWESKDDIVRIPSFGGIEVQDDQDIRQMRLYFNLNQPCFGIYTDTSPVQFLVIDKNVIDIDRFVIATENTRSRNCY